MVGRYRDLLRVFERSFALAGQDLVSPLATFLRLRPRLGYTKREVERWLVELRGPAIHADEKEPLVEADLRGVVDRMQLAAYEVVFNKTNWHSRDDARREIWTPTTGPLDPNGLWLAVQHRTEASLGGQLYDCFGAYPIHLRSPPFNLSDDCWPHSRPRKTRAPLRGLVVLPAAELKVSPSSHRS